MPVCADMRGIKTIAHNIMPVKAIDFFIEYFCFSTPVLIIGVKLR